MGNLNRLGDGEDADQDFINEIVDSVNRLSDIVWADQGALVWKGQTDAFDEIANFRIVGGEGVAKFGGKAIWTYADINYGVKFTQEPIVFVTPRAAKMMSTTISQKNASSAQVWFQRVDGGKPPPAGWQIGYSWIAFGPTA